MVYANGRLQGEFQRIARIENSHEDIKRNTDRLLSELPAQERKCNELLLEGNKHQEI